MHSHAAFGLWSRQNVSIRGPATAVDGAAKPNSIETATRAVIDAGRSVEQLRKNLQDRPTMMLSNGMEVSPPRDSEIPRTEFPSAHLPCELRRTRQCMIMARYRSMASQPRLRPASHFLRWLHFTACSSNAHCSEQLGLRDHRLRFSAVARLIFPGRVERPEMASRGR